MTRTSDDTALHALDAATGVADGEARRRADELLERIVASPSPPERAPRRRRRARLVLVPAAVAALVLGAVTLRDDDGSGVAYASWTSAPSAVAADDLDAVIDACRGQLDDDIPVVLAERRGDFVAVLFHRDVPDTAASCVAANRAGSDRVSDVSTGVGGSSGPAWTPAAGRITEGMISQYGGDRPAAFTEGAVGPGVVGVTIHAGAQTVTATVANGRYAAWWPGQAFTDGPPQPSGEGGPEPMLVYDVHLADGSVERGAAPARPS